MDKYHTSFLKKIKKLAGKPVRTEFFEKYFGNPHPHYDIRNPALRSIVRSVVHENNLWSSTELHEFITSLSAGTSATEKIAAGMVLDYTKKYHRLLKPSAFFKWLDHAEGWVEIDSLCYGHFTSDDFVERWNLWEKLLNKLISSKNISKRRAALVLLCKPVSRFRHDKMQSKAFQLINLVTHEKSVLITKAISWLLRSMIKNYRVEVMQFIDKYSDTLPSIATRETRNKLKNGKKN